MCHLKKLTIWCLPSTYAMYLTLGQEDIVGAWWFAMAPSKTLGVASITLQLRIVCFQAIYAYTKSTSPNMASHSSIGQKKKEKIRSRAIWREFESIGPILLKSPLDVGWGLLCTLRWVHSCFNQPSYIVPINTNLPCNPDISQHKYWWEGFTISIWLLGSMSCIGLRNMQIYHSGDIG